jgi:hypothetical protein
MLPSHDQEPAASSRPGAKAGLISNVPDAESFDPSGWELDMDQWDTKRGHADRGLYRGILYEPPYSIWQAVVVLIVVEICTLLCLWIQGK